MIATRSCFGHTSIDYTYQINLLFDQHKVEFVELLLAYINIHKAFFHQGHELLSIDTEGDFNTITSQVKLKFVCFWWIIFMIEFLVNKNAGRKYSKTKKFRKSTWY